MLKKHEEFFPLASAIDKKDNVVYVGSYDGEEQPESEKVISDLKTALREGVKKGHYNYRYRTIV